MVISPLVVGFVWTRWGCSGSVRWFVEGCLLFLGRLFRGGLWVLGPVVLGFYGVYSFVCDGDGGPVFVVESGVELYECSGFEFVACSFDLFWFVVH